MNDQFSHIKGIIMKEVEKDERLGLHSRKRSGHMEVDYFFLNHKITCEVHEKLHQWVNAEV